MNRLNPIVKRSFCLGLGVVTVLVAGCASMDKPKPVLTGAQEVPPVTTTATATHDISARLSKCYLSSATTCPVLTGTVWTTGINGTAAHVHQGAAGQNGPVIVTLIKTGDGVWSVPQDSALTDAQYQAYWDGLLYVNVHSDANKSGELRAQLKP